MDPEEVPEEPEEQVVEFNVFLEEAMKCILLVDGLPSVGADKLDKLEKHLKSNSSLLKTWGSPPKKVEMPMLEGKTQGFAFLEFKNRAVCFELPGNRHCNHAVICRLAHPCVAV